jgi:hypothetical protein
MIDIKETFLKLTERRYPYGKEDDVIKLLPEFNFQSDGLSNYFILIKKPNGECSDTMFTSHLDTVTSAYGRTYDYVKHVIDGDFIKTDTNTNLGADDKAGMVIMLNMISNHVPGLYYFFMGEEVGGIGATSLAEEYTNRVKKGVIPKINRCISFDRGKYEHVTTHQSRVRGCSDEFANKLSKELNLYNLFLSGTTVLEDYKWYKEFYKPNDNGGRTDSHKFLDLIPECTNISVGYFSEHTIYEKQDLKFLELLSKTVLRIDWDSLPIIRTVDGDYKPSSNVRVYGHGQMVHNYYD